MARVSYETYSKIAEFIENKFDDMGGGVVKYRNKSDTDTSVAREFSRIFGTNVTAMSIAHVRKVHHGNLITTAIHKNQGLESRIAALENAVRDLEDRMHEWEN